MMPIDIIRIYILGMIIVLAINTAIQTPSGHDYIDKFTEMGNNFLFAIPAIMLSGWVMIWLETIGPQWAYDLAGVTGLLVGVILWHFYIAWRRKVHKLN